MTKKITEYIVYREELVSDKSSDKKITDNLISDKKQDKYVVTQSAATYSDLNSAKNRLSEIKSVWMNKIEKLHPDINSDEWIITENDGWTIESNPKLHDIQFLAEIQKNTEYLESDLDADNN